MLLSLAALNLDCFRFWNQFESDRKILAVHCVKIFLPERVGVPQTSVTHRWASLYTDGYTRSKNNLVKKYGKHSEVANAHVQNIMPLPHINNSNTYKIHEFSEKF